eukprot:scaffold51953_cov22-Cyclotella_meneghiniana.AAC.1
MLHMSGKMKKTLSCRGDMLRHGDMSKDMGILALALDLDSIIPGWLVITTSNQSTNTKLRGLTQSGHEKKSRLIRLLGLRGSALAVNAKGDERD